ncbi:hypothetical protein Vretifemale_19209 [Volvox reticuliferus]|nr:hypothetical protein Vretifemale_19209 [Volvox reticuliferus]
MLPTRPLRHRITLSTLRQRFAVVFFCPGNHELWVSGRQRRHTDGFPEVPSAAAGAQELQPTEKQAGPNRGGCGAQHPQQRMVHDSLEKLAMVMTLCHELGVHVMPARLGRLQIVPLLAWHHKSFDREPDIPGIPKASPLTISDYARCTWPERIVSELEASRCFGSCPGRQHERQNQRHYQHQQQHEQQQQRQEGHVMRDCNTSAPDPATADTTAVPKAECMNSSGRCGGAGFGGDWVDGGHGSDAVAAWFDALNEPPYGWGYVHNNSTSSGTTTATSGATAATTATTTTTSGTATNSDSSSRTGTSCRPSDTERSVQTSQQGLLLRQQQQQPEHQQQHTQEHRPQHAVTQSPVAGMGEGAEEEVQVEGDVISFSHFLPLQELMPEKRYLTFPNLAKAVGSTYLAERVRRLRPQMHVFGHTHFAWDAVCDGIRYVQAPLAYPSERRFRLRSLVMTEAGGPKEKKRNGTSEGGGAATVATDTEASSAGTTSEEPTSKTPLPLTTTTASTSASVLISEPEAGPEAGPEACGTQVQHGGLQGSLKSSKAHAEPSGKGELHMGMQEHEGLRAPWPSSLDPGDARWLPLCIYRAQYTVRMLAPGDADRDRGWGVAGEGTAATAAAVDLAGAPSQLQQLQPVAKLLLRPAGGPSTRAGVMAAGFGAAGDEPEKVPEVEVLEWRSQWCPEQAVSVRHSTCRRAEHQYVVIIRYA